LRRIAICSEPLTIRLTGANPFLLLYSGDLPSGYASVWRVDWSERGAGNAIVLWLPSEARVVSPNVVLATWLALEFNQYFSEFREMAWREPTAIEAEVEIERDLEIGMRAMGGGVVVEISKPLDRPLLEVNGFDLGGRMHQLRAVVMPCKFGRLVVDVMPLGAGHKSTLARIGRAHRPYSRRRRCGKTCRDGTVALRPDTASPPMPRQTRLLVLAGSNIGQRENRPRSNVHRLLAGRDDQDRHAGRRRTQIVQG
jgi:hypothetical protein